jgi:hypothetical protein
MQAGLMQRKCDKIPGLILIGSTCRNAGKTTLALALIERLAGDTPVVGLKVTSVKPGSGCHRGEAGCGACAIKDGLVLTEERYPPVDEALSHKDTVLFRKAGAVRSFWLRAHEDETDIMAGLRQLQKAASAELAAGGMIVGESNALRRFVEPGLFVMMRLPGEKAKPSALEVMPLADIVFDNDMQTPPEKYAAECVEAFRARPRVR